MDETLGPFVLKEVIGQGGMGKVYRAYDSINHRTVALKVIKESLINNPKSKKRFLKEAYIHAKLSHPAIIPIHGIEILPNGICYSMPYIQGYTLKTLLMKIKDEPHLMPLKERLRHFMKILEALHYTHQVGYVHRDIKSDNIFIGIHKDTYLFDWGLASKIHLDQEEDLDEQDDSADLTRPGKIAGTLTHLAPERAKGVKGTIQSDIFSLGVVLYQLLTLKMPFYRKDLEHFKQVAGHESFNLPSSLNLKDDIDEALDLIVSRALASDLSKRYTTLDPFIEDLQKVIDGLPIWKDPTHLDLKKTEDWLYQDLLPLGSYLALSQKSLSWGLLSVPYAELLDNYKLSVSCPLQSNGFKVYLNLSKNKLGFDLEQAFILDIDFKGEISLYRFFALLDHKSFEASTLSEIEIVIEKIENRFFIYLNGELIFNFVSRVARICPYIGLVIDDTDFKFSSIKLFNSSSNKQISCLKLGDNLVWHHQFDKARFEYQKIVSSFQNHQEGQEALFRLGYSYIIQAKETSSKAVKKKLLNKGIALFGDFKWHKASPWEYWGKALCYEALNEKEETIKCFELGFRKYPHHPYTEELKEELVVLFSQKSIKAKKEALRLIFVALRYLDEASFIQKYPTVMDSLKEELQNCFILLKEEELSLKQKLIFSLAFVLNQKVFLEEVLQKSLDINERTNALLILAHLNFKKLTKNFMAKIALALNCPPIFTTPFENLHEFPWILAGQSLFLYGKSFIEASYSVNSQHGFLRALAELVRHKKYIKDPKCSEYDNKIIETLFLHLKKSKEKLIQELKAPFFQESERFIKSNFIISLIEKKPLDYFAYDKAALEFAIKALF